MRITVAAISEPKGKGPGGAKDETDTWRNYWTTGKNAVQLEKGVTYEVETYETERDGKIQHWIKNAKRVEAAPAAAKPNGSHYGAAKDERAIFITGVVGRAMGSGQFGLNEIKALALAAADAWDALSSRQTAANKPASPPGSIPQRVYNDEDLPEMRG